MRIFFDENKRYICCENIINCKFKRNIFSSCIFKRDKLKEEREIYREKEGRTYFLCFGISGCQYKMNGEPFIGFQMAFHLLTL